MVKRYDPNGNKSSPTSHRVSPYGTACATLAGVEHREASDLSKRVAVELQNARNRHGFAWADVEEATGIPRTTMWRMLNGKVDIPIAKLMLICEAAGISVTDVIDEATRHMPDGYLRSLLSYPNVSPAVGTVAESPHAGEGATRKGTTGDEATRPRKT